MHLRVCRNGIDEIANRVNERVLVTNDVSGRPPRAEIRMAAFRAKDGFESGLVGGIITIAILQFVHPLEAETDTAFAAIDLPVIVILVAGRKPRGLDCGISAGRDISSGCKLREES